MPASLDRIARTFADRRRSRRAALGDAAAVMAAGAAALTGIAGARAQEATPVEESATPASGSPDTEKEFLFIQSFQRGQISPKEGSDTTYELSLEQGLGQTLFFSNRPDRIAGATPTDQFLKGMPFSPDNPPNAALIVEASPGEEEIAVLELTNPRYDMDTHTATYDVTALADWKNSLEMGFREEPAELSGFQSAFGAAHLFIDDCPDGTVSCCAHYDYYSLECLDAEPVGTFTGQGFCYWPWGPHCIPCDPYYHQNLRNQGPLTVKYWNGQCNDTYPACNGICEATWSDW